MDQLYLTTYICSFSLNVWTHKDQSSEGIVQIIIQNVYSLHNPQNHAKYSVLGYTVERDGTGNLPATKRINDKTQYMQD
jgi:hypothetical protein